MGLIGWLKRKEPDTRKRRREWRTAWEASIESEEDERLDELRAGLPALAADGDDVEIEIEMLEALAELAKIHLRDNVGEDAGDRDAPPGDRRRSVPLHRTGITADGPDPTVGPRPLHTSAVAVHRRRAKTASSLACGAAHRPSGSRSAARACRWRRRGALPVQQLCRRGHRGVSRAPAQGRTDNVARSIIAANAINRTYRRSRLARHRSSARIPARPFCQGRTGWSRLQSGLGERRVSGTAPTRSSRILRSAWQRSSVRSTDSAPICRTT